jgi:hypothetical protein
MPENNSNEEKEVCEIKRRINSGNFFSSSVKKYAVLPSF